MASTLELLFWFALSVVGIQLVSFIFSAIFETEKFFDLIGSLSFFLVATLSLTVGGYLHERQVMVTTLVSVWSVRLGTFLLMRVLKVGKDSRFDGVRDKPATLFVFWMVQAVWVFVVSLPVMLLNFTAHNPTWLCFTDILGMSLWAIGFLLEGVSDYQKFLFREEDDNRDKWIETGLWKYSRHPNYLGEILLWWGIFLTSAASLQGWELFGGVIGPLYTTFQLLCISGVPLLESGADRRWGNNPDYQAYKRRTPVLSPWPSLRTKAD